MNETEENLLKVMQEFQWPDSPEIFYRLYYDESGKPLIYTMEDLPGTFIDISREDFFLSSMNCRVVNGKIIRQTNAHTSKLVPSDIGTPCHPNNIAIVVTEDQPNIKWNYRYYG